MGSADPIKFPSCNSQIKVAAAATGAPASPLHNPDTISSSGFPATLLDLLELGQLNVERSVHLLAQTDEGTSLPVE